MPQYFVEKYLTFQTQGEIVQLMKLLQEIYHFIIGNIKKYIMIPFLEFNAEILFSGNFLKFPIVFPSENNVV